MLSKRIIPCLDVRDGRTTKGIKFKDNIDIGDPVEMGRFYYEEGADEIVFYDITASSDRRPIMLDVVRRVAETIFIPFSVGGGIRSREDIRDVLLAGARRWGVNSAGPRPGYYPPVGGSLGNRALSRMGRKAGRGFGKNPSGYEMGGTGAAPSWASTPVVGPGGRKLGAAKIGSMRLTGTHARRATRSISPLISTNVRIRLSHPASGIPTPRGRARPGCADAALIASMVGYGTYTIREIKRCLAENGVKVRGTW